MDLFANKKENWLIDFILLFIVLITIFFGFRKGFLKEYQLEPTIEVTNAHIITPSPTPLILKGVASFYDRSVCGDREYGVNCKTASGEIFNDEDLTFASLDFPFGTLIEFRFNGESTVCRNNDRGPFIEGRMFDLSKGCADSLGLTGVKEVEYIINAE